MIEFRRRIQCQITQLNIQPPLQPLVGTWRGDILECIQIREQSLSWMKWGSWSPALVDPHLVTYLRSSAKPFQALPFVEAGGVEHFGLTHEELAILCASHDGTDRHVEVFRRIQKKSDFLKAIYCAVCTLLFPNPLSGN